MDKITRIMELHVVYCNDADILQDKGKVSAAITNAFAESEFEQYRIIQDRLYQSDFDKLMTTAQIDKDK